MKKPDRGGQEGLLCLDLLDEVHVANSKGVLPEELDVEKVTQDGRDSQR